MSFCYDALRPYSCRGTILLYALLYEHGNEADLTEMSFVIFMKREINILSENLISQRLGNSFIVKKKDQVFVAESAALVLVFVSLPVLTCVVFWVPAGKCAPLCLIHQLAHYCGN